MKTILILIFIIIILVVLALFLAPMVGIFFIIKKSVEKKTPQFLFQERTEMEAKVGNMANNLSSLDFSVNDITNNIEYSFRKWTTNKLTGFISNLQDERIIAFQRFDRGLKQHSRVLAVSRQFRLFIETDDLGKTIEYDGVLLGKIDKLGAITNANGIRIATTAPFDKTFLINFISGHKVEISRSYDRKVFITNPRNPTGSKRMNGRAVPSNIRREPYDPYALTDINESDFTAEELKWITAIVVFEVIHQSFDFTS